MLYISGQVGKEVREKRTNDQSSNLMNLSSDREGSTALEAREFCVQNAEWQGIINYSAKNSICIIDSKGQVKSAI